MKALVYHGPGNKSWEEVPDPKIIDPTDVIVQIEAVTICGTDLHIMKGDVPAVTDGRILGHEGAGKIVEIGSAVRGLQVGQRVTVPAITNCGTCENCKNGLPSHCLNCPGEVGWIFGHLIDGTQAEFVRVPYAETSVQVIPDSLKYEDVLFLTDIYPTAFEMGVRYGQVKPGDDVVVIGAGPVGLAAMVGANMFTPRTIIAVDLDDFRLGKAMSDFGATHAVNSGKPGWQDEVKKLCRTGKADVVMEAVGVPATLEGAYDLVKPGGHIANIGVHGKPVELPIETLWIQNITMTMGLVNGTSADMLMSLIEAGKLNLAPMATHHFKLDQMLEAYEVFGDAGKQGALKVILTK